LYSSRNLISILLKESLSLGVEQSTNISKTNNHFSPQTIENRKDHTSCGVENLDPGLGQAHKFSQLMEFTPSPLLIGSPLL
jgi:hypothetical protein